MMPKTPMTAKERKAYDEALRRIEICRRTGGPDLKLSFLGLTQLPPEIGQLQALQTLDLSVNQLRELPPELGQFQALRSLHLHGNRLRELPPEIGQLQALQNLLLHTNQLRELPPEIRRLQALRLLTLDVNQLRELPPEIGQLQALQNLYIANNQLRELPPEIGQLQEFRTFSLADNQLRELPPELAKLTNLNNLYLHGNPKLGLPPEVLGPTWLEVIQKNAIPAKPKDILDYYFRIQRPGEAAALNEFKLILVGRGDVGKTTLVEKLVTDQFVTFEKTPGVKITQWPMKIGRDEVRAHVWDFGGQEIMHGTHRFFMTERALYLVLVGGRAGMEDHDADYWLSLIRSFAGNEVPVILLLHRWQEQPFELNRSQLLEKYGPNLGFLETDSGKPPKKEINIKKLRQMIAREAAKLPGLKAKWPKVWRSVKEDLPKAKQNWMTYADFQTFCAEHEVTKAEDQEALAGRLHDLGLMLAYRKDEALRGFGVLNSMWVTDGIYKLLNDSRLQKQKGHFKPAEDFKKALPAKDYPARLYPYLLALMQKFRLCFPLDEDGKEYLIPELLSKTERELDDQFPAETSLCFTYRYDRVLPEGLLPRFIVETHVQREAENAWRTGVVLKRGDCRALVRGDLQARKITVRVVGPESKQRRELLAITREHFELIHRSYTALPVTELVPVPGHPEVELDFQELVKFEADKVAKLPKLVGGKSIMLDVKQLLDGVDVPGVDRQPKVWKEVLCEPLHVFISYSHKDERFMEQLRMALVPYIRTKELTVWADPLIEAAQDWNDEIFNNLDRADIVILLLSKDSVGSEFVTEKELPRAAKRQAKGECETVGVVIKPCSWKKLRLSEQQVVLHKGKSVQESKIRDAAWLHVTGELEKVMARIRRRLEKKKA